MNVHFRSMVPSDLLTMQQYMPAFRGYSDVRGMVAFDLDTAETLAIYAMNNWTFTSAQGHLVIIKRMVLRHKFFEEMARYMFDIANRVKVFATVIESNKQALSICKKFGWVEYARMKDGWDDGVDCVLLEVTPETCRFWEQQWYEPDAQQAA